MTTILLTERQLDDIETRLKAALCCPNAEANGRRDGQHTLSGGFTHIRCELCTYSRPRGERVEETAALVAEVRRLRFRIAELGEQGPSDRETVAEAAQMYRSLRPVIERTMTEPDRWDGDEDESFHLARYVEWLAAERAQVRAEVLTEAADEMDAHCEKFGVLGVGDRLRRMAAPAAVETGE